MTTLKDLIRAIPPLDHAGHAGGRAAYQRIGLPPRSLGRPEDLAVHLAGMRWGLTIRIICRKKLL